MGPRTGELWYWRFASVLLFAALLFWLAGTNWLALLCTSIGVVSFVLRQMTARLALRGRR
jgi:hypothetical protein